MENPLTRKQECEALRAEFNTLLEEKVALLDRIEQITKSMRYIDDSINKKYNIYGESTKN